MSKKVFVDPAVEDYKKQLKHYIDKSCEDIDEEEYINILKKSSSFEETLDIILNGFIDYTTYDDYNGN